MYSYVLLIIPQTKNPATGQSAHGK